MSATVRHGDCLALMQGMESASVDAIVTDPPYGLAFMGKEWDHGVPGEPFWREALRVAKPGSRMLAFGGTRTYHRLACAIEDAGWEIEDCISWLYGSGFPKHKSKLKPAWEPVIVARKPDTRATPLRIDECRIGTETISAHGGGINVEGRKYGNGRGIPALERGCNTHSGRWPANVCLDEEAAAALDAQSGERKSGAKMSRNGMGYHGAAGRENPIHYESDTGGASRFYYVAKASRREREAGLDGMEAKPVLIGAAGHKINPMTGREVVDVPRSNNHPTVKPLALMRWLCRLVTPPRGVVLDPFTGSGTTGCAAVLEGFRFIGCEREAEYVAIAERRIAHWAGTVEPALELGAA